MRWIILLAILGGVLAATMVKDKFALIKRFEGLRLTPYKDDAGRWTIGYGHKITENDFNGTIPSSITQAEADALLAKDATDAENAVNRLVVVPITENQKNALLSLVYNIGAGAFKGSTLLRLLNAGYLSAAAEKFLDWKYAGGRVNQGLVNRRLQEREIFLS